MILCTVFLTFYTIIQLKDRSLIFWGFQIFTQFLIYFEISVKHTNKLDWKVFFWQISAWYSAFIMLVNWILILIQQNEILSDLQFIQDLKDKIPTFLIKHQDIIGFVSLKKEDEGLQIENYT